MPAELLERYSVDPVRGFLPAGSPSMRLPPQFEPWERLAEDVPTLSMAGRFRLRARELPVRDFTSLTDPLELERAMLLLSVLGHAYVWGGERPARELPRSIAMPWWGLAEALGRKPIASHASMVLHNWRMLDADAGMKLDNLGALLQIVGGQDEQWFYLVPVAIEAEGAAALPAILRAQEASAEGAVESLVPELDFIAARLAKITAILQRTPEHCDPYIFYHRVRPFLTGWPEPGLIYEGVSREPKRFAGGSAAQSSLLQSIDAGLGVSHEDEESAPFLIEMRGYMPPKHRQFIELLERGPPSGSSCAARSGATPGWRKPTMLASASWTVFAKLISRSRSNISPGRPRNRTKREAPAARRSCGS